MLSSMYSGVSGLKAHQTKMDIIGNNIANVNTTAYKTSNVVFEEVFSQLIEAASQPSDSGKGGTNPQQIGLGVSVGNISTLFEQGSLQNTSNPFDFALDGDGFFVLSDGLGYQYTRAGNFSFDVDGNLVTGGGSMVQGWNLGSATAIDITQPVEAINLDNIIMQSRSTSEIQMSGNINSSIDLYNSTTGENYLLNNVTVYDSLGESHTISFKIMKTDANEYSYEVLESDAAMAITAGSTGGQLIFGSDGTFDAASSTVPALTITMSNGAGNITIASADLDFSGVTQNANDASLSLTQNGYTSGEMLSFSVDQEGKIIGTFSNGKQRHIATIAVASFINDAGLEKVGENQYISTWNSGEAQIGQAGAGGRGSIKTMALEMSNVDLAKEFTEMIVAQRGFQANSRIITTADELLQELVSLKR